MTLSARALAGLPEIVEGDDLAMLIVERARACEVALGQEQVLVVAHKVVSKAEGRTAALEQIVPGDDARALAAEHGKDARLVAAVLEEAHELVRADRGVLIARTRHGFVCANAGVDLSNAPAGTLIMLPVDPDRSARGLRARLRELTGAAPAVVIADSFGRAWRHGQCDVAIGLAGLAALEDWCGRRDGTGRELRATWLAIADQAAAAADLVRAKDSREPVVVLDGLERHITAEDGPGASALVRARGEDLFR